VDEAFIAQTGAGGAGMILRDSKRLIFLACRSLVFCSSALESELQACLEGPNFSLNLSHDKILVETDSLELVQMATCKARDGYCVGHLVGDLRLLLVSERVISISKIHRKENGASHQARVGMVENRTQVWLGSAPEVILDRIIRDCNVTHI
jgi:hypothetical protein